ncbi:MAG: type II toxin-antitoxin system MqsA family antitoxin [Rhodospirillaceae bacterium]|nr:type II toxin-antitoxin system MqsA family antitoxin [Rhodospirillaceae bacterium]
MAKTPRQYPEILISAESGRPMKRGLKRVPITVAGRVHYYNQPGWWCDLKNPDDLEGQLVDEDNQVAEMARRTLEAKAKGAIFTPLAIRAIRIRCGLSQRDAGRLFGTGEKSFEKYESGQIKPSKPTIHLLRLAMQKPDLFRKPKSPSRPGQTDVALIRKTIKAANLDRYYGALLGTK